VFSGRCCIDQILYYSTVLYCTVSSVFASRQGILCLCDDHKQMVQQAECCTMQFVDLDDAGQGRLLCKFCSNSRND
jgi:hypothetical protein